MPRARQAELLKFEHYILVDAAQLAELHGRDIARLYSLFDKPRTRVQDSRGLTDVQQSWFKNIGHAAIFRWKPRYSTHSPAAPRHRNNAGSRASGGSVKYIIERPLGLNRTRCLSPLPLMAAQKAAGLMCDGGDAMKARVQNGPEVAAKPITLAEAGIDKHLAQRAREAQDTHQGQDATILARNPAIPASGLPTRSNRYFCPSGSSIAGSLMIHPGFMPPVAGAACRNPRL